MRNKSLTCLLSVLISAALLIGWLALIQGTILFTNGAVLAVPGASAPTIQALWPNTVPNHLDASIAITGAEFTASFSGTQIITSPAVYLGRLTLKQVTWISSTRLDAVLPWGFDPGVYTLTVVNSDRGTGSLPAALTVTQGIGVWTTGGPYGGSVNELAIDTNETSTVYANLGFMGLFKSQDSGGSWHNIFPGYVTRSALKPGNPDTIYLSGQTNDGDKLLRSLDGGESWQAIWDGRAWALGVSQANPEVLYIAEGSNIQRSLNSGASWASASGDLPVDASVATIALDPANTEVVYLGVSSGQLFKTVNGGAHWQAIGSSFGETWWRVLTVDPHFPQRVYAAGWHGAEFVARSQDGGVTWEPMVLSQGESFANDIQIHPAISGTLYALTFGSIYQSVDGGATWEKYYTAPGGWVLLLNPQTGLPYFIGHNGKAIYRSDDGGINWQVHNDGLAGVQPHEIAASPADLAFVYVAADDAGGFATNDGGQSWRAVDSGPHLANAVAADPFSPTVAYLGGENAVFKTTDGGQIWVAHPLPASGHQEPPRITALEIDSHDPNRIYAGTGDWNFTGGPEQGWLYQSMDAGETWETLTVTFPISPVADIAIDPMDRQTLYVATGRRWVDSTERGSGIIKTSNGGATWQFVNQGLTARNITRIAINPNNPNTLYAGANLPDFVQPGGLFKSVNGGETWEQVQPWLRISGLDVDPLVTDTVYAGSYWAGLMRSRDAGANWERVEGALGQLSSLCLEVTVVESRTVIYAGISGGVFSGGTAASPEIVHPLAGTEQFYGSGVYRLVIDRRQHPEFLYLPLVTRDSRSP